MCIKFKLFLMYLEEKDMYLEEKRPQKVSFMVVGRLQSTEY